MIKKAIRWITILIFLFIVMSISAQDNKTIIGKENGPEETRMDRLAIVIGIDDYLNDNISDLRYACSDAEKVAKVLEEQGVFDVHLFTNDNGSYPTRNNIYQELENANYLSSKEMIKSFVFYFSGHGFQNKGENYLAPMELDSSNMVNTAISLEEVLRIINEIQKEAKAMVFMDACRNNRGNNKSVGEGFSQDDTSHGYGILYSTQPGNFSWEIKELGGGVYTYFLVKALKGEADSKPVGNEDGYVSFRETVVSVTNGMREWSKKYPNISQIPWESTDRTGEFYITKSNKNYNNVVVDDEDIVDNNEPDFNNNYFETYENPPYYADKHSRIALFNACSDDLKVDIVDSNNLRLFSNINTNSFSDYINVPIKDLNFSVYEANTKQVLMNINKANINKGRDHIIIIYGNRDSMEAKLMVKKTRPAFIRVSNNSPDTANRNIKVFIDGREMFYNVEYSEPTEFIEIEHGIHEILVKDGYKNIISRKTMVDSGEAYLLNIVGYVSKNNLDLMLLNEKYKFGFFNAGNDYGKVDLYVEGKKYFSNISLYDYIVSNNLPNRGLTTFHITKSNSNKVILGPVKADIKIDKDSILSLNDSGLKLLVKSTRPSFLRFANYMKDKEDIDIYIDNKLISNDLYFNEICKFHKIGNLDINIKIKHKGRTIKESNVTLNPGASYTGIITESKSNSTKLNLINE